MASKSIVLRDYDAQRDCDAIVSLWLATTVEAHPFLSNEFVEQERLNMINVYLPNTKTTVAVRGNDNDVVVGFIAMMGDEVGGLFVDVAAHGQGIGYALMQSAIEAADGRSLELDVFAANDKAQAFYKRQGFAKVAEHEHRESGQLVYRFKLQKKIKN
jgi:putative acetyltransferase